MTLLCSTLAAVITTVVWYLCPQRDSMRLGTLSLMYWGASLMWLVDAVTEYLQEGAAYFQPAAKDMLNDTFFRGVRSGFRTGDLDRDDPCPGS